MKQSSRNYVSTMKSCEALSEAPSICPSLSEGPRANIQVLEQSTNPKTERHPVLNAIQCCINAVSSNGSDQLLWSRRPSRISNKATNDRFWVYPLDRWLFFKTTLPKVFRKKSSKKLFEKRSSNSLPKPMMTTSKVSQSPRPGPDLVGLKTSWPRVQQLR